VPSFVERLLGPEGKALPLPRPGRMCEHGRQPASPLQAEPLLHRHAMATEQGRGRLNHVRLTSFEQIKQLETCFSRSGLLAAETLVQICFRFSNLELVNACPLCCLNSIVTVYHL